MKKGELKLRAMEPEDLEVLYEVENDTSLWGVGLSNTPYSHFALKEFIANTTNDIYTDKQLRLIAECDGQTTAILDVMAFEPEHRRAEIGIVVLRKYRQQGIATAAIQQILDYCREKLHIHLLYAWVPEDNTPSVRLFKKLNFTATTVKEWLFDGENFKNALLMQLFL